MKQPKKDPLDPESYALETAEIEPASMKVLYSMIDEQLETEKEVAELELKLKDAKKRLRDLSEKKIPKMALDELQLQTFKSPSGVSVEIQTDLKASIAKNQEAKSKAIDYLRKTGNGAIVKEKLVIDISDHSELPSYRKTLSDAGYAFIETFDINTTRFKSFCRQELEAGNKDFDPKTFGVFQYRRTVIK